MHLVWNLFSISILVMKFKNRACSQVKLVKIRSNTEGIDEVDARSLLMLDIVS